ncbi:hypothetical protein NL676_007085 [Syzygium grande]|nr:hypothetical protein NL676_007085 [Syzygium grande]
MEEKRSESKEVPVKSLREFAEREICRNEERAGGRDNEEEKMIDGRAGPDRAICRNLSIISGRSSPNAPLVNDGGLVGVESGSEG